ncbi:MAG: thiamine phosphate synthase [candidate division NC10 bacterium]|nr:thiamine phosphate synthase [candidate division NC10 bacterium]
MGSSVRNWGLYVITDRKQTQGRPLEEVVEASLRGGARAFQLREKDLEAKDLYELAGHLMQVTRREGATLLVNDRIDIALALDLDGVHLARRSFPTDVARKLLGVGKLIGASCHSLDEALEAEEGGADFLVLGPIYETPSKLPYGPPLGREIIRRVREKASLPIFAIGGIKPQHVPEVLAAGANGVAVISAVMAAPDPMEATQELLRHLQRPAPS